MRQKHAAYATATLATSLAVARALGRWQDIDWATVGLPNPAVALPIGAKMRHYAKNGEHLAKLTLERKEFCNVNCSPSDQTTSPLGRVLLAADGAVGSSLSPSFSAMKQLIPWGAALAATLCLDWAGPALAQPILQQHWPAANATAAAPNGGVLVKFALAPG